jgi:hypothetical protein
MNALQQNPSEQPSFPKIPALTQLAAIQVAEKLFRDSTYYHSFVKLPTILKREVFSTLLNLPTMAECLVFDQEPFKSLQEDLKAIVYTMFINPTLLTKRVHKLLREDHSLQRFIPFCIGDNDIVTRDDISRIRNNIRDILALLYACIVVPASLVFASFMVARYYHAHINSAAIVSSGGHDANDAAILWFFLSVGLPCVVGFAISICAGFVTVDVRDKLTPQRQLIPELSELVDIIYEIVKRITSNEIEIIPQINISEAQNLISLISSSKGGCCRDDYSREQFRNILIDFNTLLEKFTAEFYKEVLKHAFNKLQSKPKISEIGDGFYKEVLEHLVYQAPIPDERNQSLMSSRSAPAELTDIRIETPRVASSRYALLPAQKLDDKIPLLLEAGQPPPEIKNYGALEAAYKPR